MWWRKKKEEPPQAPPSTPSTYLLTANSLLRQYFTASSQMQKQNAQFLRGYGGQSISGWSGQFQSSLPPHNLAIIALQSALGKEQKEWTHAEALCLAKATHFLEAFFTKGDVHDWEAFLSICAGAKSGDMELLKGTTTAALLGEKKSG